MIIHLLFAIFITISQSLVLPQWQRIREQEEIVTEIHPDKDARFYVRMTNPYAPLIMYVTPCGGQVHWQLYSVASDIHDVMRTEPFTDNPNVELIAGEAGDRRMSFYTPHIHAERILIVLSSTQSASARIFIANSQRLMDEQYPPLPEDTRLGLAIATPKQDTTSALVNWKISDGVRNARHGRYRFCAIVSRRENDWAVCDHIDEGLESIHCVENDMNSMHIEKLRAGKRYFITVFVRDSIRGTTSSYSTLEANVPDTPEMSARRSSSRKQSQQGIELYDGNLQSGSLPASKGGVLNYDFVLPKNATNTKRVLLVVHACDGYVRVNVYRNGRLLKRSDAFSGFRRFLVLNVRSGHLRFQITNDDSRTKTVRLWASTRPDKSPYPLLPDDTSVKVSRRTCSSATLQWLRAPDAHVEYCLYKRKEKANFLEELVSKVDNLCAGGLESSALVGCYAHRGPQSSGEVDGLIETRIDGLRSLSTYRFDLLARPLHRPNSQYLPYRTVWVRTTKDC